MFLATTALHEFWDSTQEIFFLGEWCKLESNKSHWKNRDAKVMPYIWDSTDKTENAIAYCAKVYEEVLDVLTNKLNESHRFEKDKEYWQIIIGNWLIGFIHVLYDRYVNVETFLENYSEFDTILLSETHYVTPLDNSDFTERVLDDEYNLQLYSQILRFKGFGFKAKNLEMKQKTIFSKLKKLKKLIFLKSLNLLTSKHDITVTSPYFSGGIKSYLKLLWVSKGRVRFDGFDDEFYFNILINKEKRRIFRGIEHNDEFTRLLYVLLEINFPSLFLEGFKSFNEFARKRGGEKTAVYATANALHSNNLYKFWVAENRNDIKLVSIQHGGGYGVDKINIVERYERKITDFFFTWGWVEDTKTIPAGHEKISQNINRNKNGYVLYCMTDAPKYIHRLQNGCFSSATKTVYLPNIYSFFETVGGLNRFLCRGYMKDFGFGVLQNFKAKFPSIAIDDHLEKFHTRLKGARVCLIDNMFTTYLETLAMNFPTIIFIDKNSHSFRHPEIINLLVDAKILFYDEKEAAVHLNAVYDDIDTWWCALNVQNARKVFCHHYARTSGNWEKEWMNAFAMILEH